MIWVGMNIRIGKIMVDLKVILKNIKDIKLKKKDVLY